MRLSSAYTAVCAVCYGLLFLILADSAAEAQHFSQQIVGKCSVRLFWFMSISSGSDQEYWDYGTDSSCNSYSCAVTSSLDYSCACAAVKVAVLSAKQSSPNLVPVLLFANSTTPDPPELQSNLQWFKRRGIVYHHSLTFASDMQVSFFVQTVWLLARCTPVVCLRHSVLAGCSQQQQSHVRASVGGC